MVMIVTESIWSVCYIYIYVHLHKKKPWKVEYTLIWIKIFWLKEILSQQLLVKKPENAQHARKNPL